MKAKDGFKVCNMCHLRLPVEEFSKNKSTEDGYRTRCKSCERSTAIAGGATSADIVRKEAPEFVASIEQKLSEDCHGSPVINVDVPKELLQEILSPVTVADKLQELIALQSTIENAEEYAADVKAKADEYASILSDWTFEQTFISAKAVAESYIKNVVRQVDEHAADVKAKAEEQATNIKQAAENVVATMKQEAEQYAADLKAEAEQYAADLKAEAEQYAADEVYKRNVKCWDMEDLIMKTAVQLNIVGEDDFPNNDHYKRWDKFIELMSMLED